MFKQQGTAWCEHRECGHSSSSISTSTVTQVIETIPPLDMTTAFGVGMPVSQIPDPHWLFVLLSQENSQCFFSSSSPLLQGSSKPLCLAEVLGPDGLYAIPLSACWEIQHGEAWPHPLGCICGAGREDPGSRMPLCSLRTLLISLVIKPFRQEIE